MECLEESLEDDFDEEARKAWLRFNKFMFDQMEVGMNKVENEIEEREKLVAEKKGKNSL